METLGARLKTFSLWGSAAGLVFFCVYPTTNHLVSLRSHHYEVAMAWEQHIPFVPEWIWVYGSMYALFAFPPFFMPCPALRRLGKQLIAMTLVAGLCFLLLPTTLTFERVTPPEGLLKEVYEHIFRIDKPHNMVPSLHVIWSTAIAVALSDYAPRGCNLFFLGWAAAIALSTLLVHQHQVLDLVVAYLFVFIARKTIGETTHAQTTPDRQPALPASAG